MKYKKGEKKDDDDDGQTAAAFKNAQKAKKIMTREKNFKSIAIEFHCV